MNNMRELQTDVAALLYELADFLESLNGIELTEKLHLMRETLISRLRVTLQRKSSESPEPYLDMNASKNLMPLASLEENEQPQEYVCADDRQAQRVSLQHYYETFQDFQANGSKEKDYEMSTTNTTMDNVILLYSSYSTGQAKSRAIKHGPLLHLKRERKMFAPFNVFWLNRSCWVCLVDSHLLLYANERESRPYLVIPLQGYKSRPAPGALSRDPRRSEAAFEIYCPGDPTFQFVAKNVQEMKEWVEAISESVMSDDEHTKTRAATIVEILELDSNERMCIELVKEEQEKYQDVLNSPNSMIKEKQSTVKTISSEKIEDSTGEAPPLPVRTRRLPSLPSQDRISYVPKDELYEEEGLYHKIEDVRVQREYQNCQMHQVAKEIKLASPKVDLVQETYNDVETITKKFGLETYDDVQNVVQDKSKHEPITYDDIQTAAGDPQMKAEKEKSSKTSKSPQKRSFFDRVRNRKESMKKDDNKSKSSIISLPSINLATTPQLSNKVPELPCYDDVSSLANRESCATSEEIEDNYLSPPPPRPIYSRPPTIIKCAVQNNEIYDDIGSCSQISSNCCIDYTSVDVIKNNPNLQRSSCQEHYQVPKSANRKVVEHQEELYDDIALFETFKNRQRESIGTSPMERSIWNRFGSGKRPRIFDHIAKQATCNEPDDNSTNDISLEQQLIKVKSFQKFINKVENKIGKATKNNGVT